MALMYLILSFVAQRKISKSTLITFRHKKRLKILNWLLPYYGALNGIYNQKKIVIPLDKENIGWIINSFNWIINEFGIGTLLNSEIIIPVKEKIPININPSVNYAKELVDFVAEKMGINKNSISVDFYNQSQMKLDANIITQRYEDDKTSSGQYWGKTKRGKYQISLETSQLNDPIRLIATIAHELSHIKLLGEKRIKKNDENLTDLIPIIFGFGIFNANSIFQFHQDSFGWRMSSQGYLNENMYGFALAIFANIRNDLHPNWSIYLKTTVREEFEKSMIYIEKNKLIIPGKNYV
jgi:hypothetical protein